ncbi:NADPH oxidase organizer 1-like [Poeciliopsis prolifica]|uniref:NADPH oxidase organizer 1-like n=1 Tax=Poeciliopsis prolifica TaxID=188132 RepID=UPI002413F678|nr:NADPH oxidase organizer 1-like [Poeciliopsis prolifica]
MTGDQRYVISVRAVAGVRREKPRLKTFMLSVLWSDESEVIVYRSFQDFRSFHKQLKRRFPNFNPFRKNQRKIPKFSGKARRSLQQTGSRKSVRQMSFLQSYCEELLCCDQTVTLSSEVTRFFTPRDHDLQTDFTKNTVMILMSDEAQDAAGGARPQQVGGVTHPFVTQTYRCVAPYETTDTKNRTFKAAAGDQLDVLIKDPAGWWLVESEDKRLAWFPAPYLELCEEEDEEEEEEEGRFLGGSLYCAVRNYSTSKSDEVGVAIGCVVEVLRKSDDGWWLVRCGSKVGYLPSMYLQPYINPRRHLPGRHLHSSSLYLTSSGSRGSRSSQPVQNQEPGSRRGSAVPERLPRAQSLDVLSESRLQDAAAAASSSSSSAASHSNNSIFSSFSSSSASSSSSLRDEPRHPDPSRSSRSSTGSSGSAGSKGSESGPAPGVPRRPDPQEILLRCSTMTRKAALASRTRLQAQADPVHSRL